MKKRQQCQHFIVDANCVCKRCGKKIKLLSLKEEMKDLSRKHKNLNRYL